MTNDTISDRDIDFRNALFSVTQSIIDEVNAVFVTGIYNRSKLPEIKSKALRLLYNKPFPFLKDFFDSAFKKERYLHMKLLAMRGLSQFLPEKEIEQLMNKLNLTLSKRPLTTPYNYVEYEWLKGKNLLPYLRERYGYKCFEDCWDLVSKQYEEMPLAFKGHFTVDANGDIINLLSPDQSKWMIQRFFESQRK